MFPTFLLIVGTWINYCLIFYACLLMIVLHMFWRVQPHCHIKCASNGRYTAWSKSSANPRSWVDHHTKMKQDEGFPYKHLAAECPRDLG
jgi:hypothetical protein